MARFSTCATKLFWVLALYYSSFWSSSLFPCVLARDFFQDADIANWDDTTTNNNNNDDDEPAQQHSLYSTVSTIARDATATATSTATVRDISATATETVHDLSETVREISADMRAYDTAATTTRVTTTSATAARATAARASAASDIATSPANDKEHPRSGVLGVVAPTEWEPTEHLHWMAKFRIAMEGGPPAVPIHSNARKIATTLTRPSKFARVPFSPQNNQKNIPEPSLPRNDPMARSLSQAPGKPASLRGALVHSSILLSTTAASGNSNNQILALPTSDRLLQQPSNNVLAALPRAPNERMGLLSMVQSLSFGIFFTMVLRSLSTHTPPFSVHSPRQRQRFHFTIPGTQKQTPLASSFSLSAVDGDLMTSNAATPPTFDFVVGGFPKCGTTSLLKTFALHPEIDMAAQEQCTIAAPGLTDAVVLQKLDATLQSMPSVSSSSSTGSGGGDDPAGESSPSGARMKRAFKCPNAMFTYKSIGRLEKHSPAAKLVVGIRHPVHMMQSFYNYRVTEIYERGLNDVETIPDFLELVSKGYEPWKLVSLASVRFELFLQQLGKTVLTPNDFAELSKYTEFGYELAIKPSNFSIFLYTVDQLEDLDETRSEQLLTALQTYLELSTPIPRIGHENKNHAVGDAAYPESIVICDPQYALIRKDLVRNGIHTANWLRDHFLQSPDVTVANPEHFLATLETWSTDPCDEVGINDNDDDDAAASEFDSVLDADHNDEADAPMTQPTVVALSSSV